MSGSGRDLDAEMIPGVIGRLEKTVIDCPDPRALAEFYCQVLGMRINEDIGSWVVIGSGLACASWPSSARLTGFRRAGLTQLTHSKCIWTSASATPTRPKRNCSAWAPLALLVNAKWASGFPPTPSAIHSASFSSSTAQIEPASASGRYEGRQGPAHRPSPWGAAQVKHNLRAIRAARPVHMQCGYVSPGPWPSGSYG